MKRIFSLIMLISSLSHAQIEMILDNEDQTGFTVQGNWGTKTSTGCYGGNARFIKRGTGINYVQWQQSILFPGEYSVDMHLINYKYARDAHCYLKTTLGDSLIVVDQFYQPDGWKNLGAFEISEDFIFKITDQFADTGTYVYADAIKLTYTKSTYNIEGSVNPSQTDLMSYFQVDLLQSATNKSLASIILDPNDREFIFWNLPAGQYKIQCSAWGYDTLIVDSVVLQDANVTDLNLTMNPSSVIRHNLSGSILLDDSSNVNICRVALYANLMSNLIGIDSVSHGSTFTFLNLPEGDYHLVFISDSYLPDSTTYTNVHLNQDITLVPLLLYAYFQIAWCSDMHIGAGYENNFQNVITNINSINNQLDFIINSGDLTEKGLNTEFVTYKSLISSCKIPVYNIAGNHDTKWSESGLQYFINNVGPLHLSFDHKGFHFIGMNSGTPMKGGSGYVDPSEIIWLKEDLANLSDPDMPIVFITHMPVNIGSLANYWEVLDILKNYKTVFIMVGHGHTNSTYNFEGIPGAMTMDTYNSTTSGFSIVSLSKKEISVTPFLNSTNTVGTTWLRVPYSDQKQPEIQFTNLSDCEIISSSKTIQIQTEKAMSQGTYVIRTDTDISGSLTGAGTNWSLTLNPAGLENGSHVVLTTLVDASGNSYSRSIEFYTENGNYPKADWRFDSKAIIISTPAYDSSNVYFGTSDGKIYALNLKNGSQVWSSYQTGAGIFSSPTVKDSTLFIGSSDGNLYAISTNTGNLKWSYNTGKAVISAVVVVDSLVYFAGNNVLCALNVNSQQKVWEYSTGGLIECKPAIAGEKIVVTSWDRSVHCINRFSGTSIWKWNKQSSFYYAPAACWPVVSDTRVFITDPAKNLTAISLESGTTIWESNSEPQVWESIGISEDKSRIYVRTLDGLLYAFAANTDTKQQVWVANPTYGYDSNPSMPIEKSGTVFSGGKKGFVTSVVASTGNINWRYWTSQALVSTVTPLDGAHVLAVSLDGTVTLIEGDPTEQIETSERKTVPTKNSLLTPYPNPFNSTTRIRYTLKEPQNVRIAVFDLTGRELYAWQIRNQPDGYYEIDWNGLDRSGNVLPSGVYFIRIDTDKFNSSAKMILLK